MPQVSQSADHGGSRQEGIVVSDPKKPMSIMSIRKADTPRGLTFPRNVVERPCSRCGESVIVVDTNARKIDAGEAVLICQVCADKEGITVVVTREAMEGAVRMMREHERKVIERN